MLKKFRHLDWSDRLCIEKCYNGKSCFEIARLLGFARPPHTVRVKRGCIHSGAENQPSPMALLCRSHRTTRPSGHGKGPEIKLGNNYGFAADIPTEYSILDIIVSQKRHDHEWTVQHRPALSLHRSLYIPGITNRPPEKVRRKRRAGRVKAHQSMDHRQTPPGGGNKRPLVFWSWKWMAS